MNHYLIHQSANLNANFKYICISSKKAELLWNFSSRVLEKLKVVFCIFRRSAFVKPCIGYGRFALVIDEK